MDRSTEKGITILGQHTSELLSEIGYSKDAIETMKEQGIVIEKDGPSDLGQVELNTYSIKQYREKKSMENKEKVTWGTIFGVASVWFGAQQVVVLQVAIRR